MKIIQTVLLACFLYPAVAVVRVPAYISDRMMFQRDMPVNVWGWADKGESVTVRLNGQSQKVKAGKDGTWEVALKAMAYGGPYELTIQGKSNTLVFENILIGDIWVCSGQSNMQWTVSLSKDAEKEIGEARYPNIRLLTVSRKMAVVPLQAAAVDNGGWLECSPETVGNFSAVGYFFGRELYRNLDVPVGLIDCSLGATNIETWTSVETIGKYPEYREKIEEMQGRPEELQKELDIWRWMDYGRGDIDDTGMKEKWYVPDLSSEGWTPTQVPGWWDERGIRGQGPVWYRKEIVLTAEQAAQPLSVYLGKVDDRDDTFLNGQKIGTSGDSNTKREYMACTELLREGTNILAIRVIDVGGRAGLGLEDDPMYCLSGKTKIPLNGEWLYRESTFPFRPGFLPNEYPALLYQAMLLPLTRFPVRGAIWYQGESNAGEAWKYRSLLPDMIVDWRNAWKQNNLPFYFVQLANFLAPDEQPVESQWAELRESQHKTLSLPYTGEAVTIDIGDAADIHPKNKQEVGRRLALNALAKTYGKPVEYSGPEYVSMKTEGDRIVLTFSHTGDGLIMKKRKYEYLQGFTIAGADRKFVWAQARIESNNTVTVFSNEVKSPVAVRYAWANNPDEANLYNSYGLPASPFRTDDWKLSTQK
jgi:sialate O-acetylesterase